MKTLDTMSSTMRCILPYQRSCLARHYSTRKTGIIFYNHHGSIVQSYMYSATGLYIAIESRKLTKLTYLCFFAQAIAQKL